MPFAHKRFGGYCNITHCCKSHHKTIAKFSSNPTISFSRKSTRKDPSVKTCQKKPFLSTCYGDPFATEVSIRCEAATKKLTFSTTSVFLRLKVPSSLTETFLRRRKIPGGGVSSKKSHRFYSYAINSEVKNYTVPVWYKHIKMWKNFEAPNTTNQPPPKPQTPANHEII